MADHLVVQMHKLTGFVVYLARNDGSSIELVASKFENDKGKKRWRERCLDRLQHSGTMRDDSSLDHNLVMIPYIATLGVTLISIYTPLC